MYLDHTYDTFAPKTFAERNDFTFWLK